MQKIVLVTGASSGIGKAIANYLVTKNYKVYGTSRHPKPDASITFKLIALDVTKQASIDTAVATIIKAEGRIDVLINNAGVGITGPIEDTPIAQIKHTFDTNFFGAINLIKAVLPKMRTNKFGYIINITSIAGYMGLPFRGAYSASKGALELLTEALRMEVKSQHINVVNVAPGDFATDIAKGRYHTPVTETSAYKDSYALNLELMNADVNTGMAPEKMGPFIYKILQKKQPKIHYKIGGFLEKFSIVLKRVLPDKLYERLIMSHYKL